MNAPCPHPNSNLVQSVDEEDGTNDWTCLNCQKHISSDGVIEILREEIRVLQDKLQWMIR